MGVDVIVKARGFERTRKLLQETQRQMDKRIAEDLHDWVAHFLLERIRVNTPIKTGATRESLTVTLPVIRLHRVSVRIQATTPWALRIHEETYNLGPISRQQPMQPEGGVGNKYITRVLRYHARSLRLVLGASVTRTVRKLFPKSGRVQQLR